MNPYLLTKDQLKEILILRLMKLRALSFGARTNPYYATRHSAEREVNELIAAHGIVTLAFQAIRDDKMRLSIPEHKDLFINLCKEHFYNDPPEQPHRPRTVTPLSVYR